MELEREQKEMIKAVLIFTSAIQTLPEIRPVSFKWVRNLDLHAGTERISYLEDILCLAVIP